MGKSLELEVPPLALDYKYSSSSSLCPLEVLSNNVMKSSIMVPAKRGVQFQSEPTIHRYLYDYDDDDDDPVGVRWYTAKDYQRLRSQNMAHLQPFRRDRNCPSSFDWPCEDEEWTCRGFEYIVDRYPRRGLRQQHAHRVLQFQQEMLRLDCWDSPLALADYARNSSGSTRSQSRARAMALSDEDDAQEIHNMECGSDSTTMSCSNMVVRSNPEDMVSTHPALPAAVIIELLNSVLHFFRCWLID